jgi:hypothetical protein
MILCLFRWWYEYAELTGLVDDTGRHGDPADGEGDVPQTVSP